MFVVINARKNVNVVSTIDAEIPDLHLAALIFGSQALIVETFASRMLWQISLPVFGSNFEITLDIDGCRFPLILPML